MEEHKEERQGKKGGKGKWLLFILLVILGYLFAFKPMVVAHCRKREDIRNKESVFASYGSEERFNDCVKEIDPLQ